MIKVVERQQYGRRENQLSDRCAAVALTSLVISWRITITWSLSMALFCRIFCHKSRLVGSTKLPSLFSVRSESSLATLRKKTGYALNLCKQALDKHDNDAIAAERWLKEQAAIHGWAKAAKLQGRASAEGLIGVFINQESNIGLALELNCETDFVARNEVFRDLLASLTNQVASSSLVQSLISNENSGQPLIKVHLDQEKLEPFKDHLVGSVSKLGENLVLKRAIAIASQQSVRLVGYAHAVGGQKNSLNNIYMGKYATVLAYSDAAHEDLDYEKQWLEERQAAAHKSQEQKRTREIERAKREIAAAKDLGQDIDEQDVNDSISQEDGSEVAQIPKNQLPRLLCQHIIAMKPSKLRYSHNEVLDLLKLSDIRKGSGQVGNDDDDMEALLDQRFIINNAVIREVLKQTGISIVDFERIECGRSE